MRGKRGPLATEGDPGHFSLLLGFTNTLRNPSGKVCRGGRARPEGPTAAVLRRQDELLGECV